MADLFTHLAAARLPAAFVRDRRLAALLVIGTFLPDLVSKGLYWILRCADNFETPSHTLAGLALLSYAAALLVGQRLRRPAFAAIFAGGVIHLAVDLLKENLGAGSARLFYPLSIRSYELGLIDPLDVILLVPLDIAILWAAWALERRLRRVQQ
jgi:membrane-bound metal-dependent hydrolase YbcI (DUF457 family)